MNVKAHDLVEHGLDGGIDRDLGRQCLDQAGQPVQPLAIDQQRGQSMAARAHRCAQHHLTLGDEAALPSDQIPLAHLAEGLDAVVGGIFDEDQQRREGFRRGARGAGSPDHIESNGRPPPRKPVPAPAPVSRP